MRYMPCGSDQGQAASERARTRAFHGKGLAVVTYMREALCATYAEPFQRGLRERVFTRRRDGSAYTYTAFVGSGTTDVAQIDFSNPRAQAFYASLLDRATGNGYDGWMEDYGEYTPPDSVSANGMGGDRMQNYYPVLYHRAGRRYTAAFERPLIRFTRSGWTGVHRYTQIKWGGDPTTVWGFDGLRSAVIQALTMGLSGISTWGSDVGGFFTLSDPVLTPELLDRWVQFGAVSGVMRTKAAGIATPLDARPQVWEERNLPNFRRYAKLRTQLYPYVVAADAAYRRTGMPMMRHLALVDPADPRAVAREDEFLFGPDLLAAPVTAPGARSRRLYVPRGAWIDFWRAVDYDAGSGALGLGARRARVLAGARSATVPAPADELPLLARAGTLLPLLPPDVDTLADYGPAGTWLVKLRDRRDRLVVLALPRGRSSAAFGTDGTLRSREGAGTWTLELRAPRAQAIALQASLATLRSPFTPRVVRVNGRTLPRSAWRFDRARGVLRLSARGRSLRIEAAADTAAFTGATG